MHEDHQQQVFKTFRRALYLRTVPHHPVASINMRSLVPWVAAHTLAWDCFSLMLKVPCGQRDHGARGGNGRVLARTVANASDLQAHEHCDVKVVLFVRSIEGRKGRKGYLTMRVVHGGGGGVAGRRRG